MLYSKFKYSLIFMILSSIISYLRYITFHADVYDLGVSSDLIKNALIYPIVYNKIIYFLMYPIYSLFPSQVGLMVLAFIVAGSPVPSVENIFSSQFFLFFP